MTGAAASSAFLAGARRKAHAADVDVIVVGAGAAGLSAAHDLVAQGRTVAVLEARGRTGGRAFTDASLGIPYEAGAMFIHWAERNPWREIAAALQVPLADEDWRGGFFVYSGGKPMSETERLKRRGVFNQIDRRLETADIASRDVSIADLVKDIGPDLAPIAASGLLLSIGEESERISARDYQRLWAGDDLVVPSGYGNLVSRYGEGLPVRLRQPVGEIRWDGPGVGVTTPSGTIRAKACIVTVPVGVLKAGGIRFTPALPASTRDALNGLVMGALSKIALKVEGSRLGLTAGASLLEAGSPRRLMNIDMFPGDRDIVVGHCGGDYARELCEAGPAAARAHLTDLLAAMFGEDARKCVTGAAVPSWWTDPFSRGSYSVCLPGKADARDALARPIGDRIWLAGEATAGGGAMTVGGATLAGRAAATAVLARTKA